MLNVYHINQNVLITVKSYFEISILYVMFIENIWNFQTLVRQHGISYGPPNIIMATLQFDLIKIHYKIFNNLTMHKANNNL